jgi:uncharacterized protein Yka (UPF0111/DUF47 family)
MADINVLMNQSEHKAAALALEADHTLDAINKIHDQAVALASAIAHANQQTHQHFSTLSAKLVETEQHLTHELQSSKDQWNTLHGKVGQMEHRVDGAVSEMKTQLNAIKTQIAQATTEIDQEFHTTQEQLGKISHQAYDLEAHASQYRDTETHTLENFRQLLENTKNNFDQHKAALIQHLSTLEQDAKSKLDVLLNDLGHLEQESDRHFINLHTTLERTTHDMITDLAHKFTDEFPRELDSAGDVVNQAMTALHHTGLDKLHVLDGKFGEIFGKVDEFTRHLEEIKPVLEKIEHFA